MLPPLSGKMKKPRAEAAGSLKRGALLLFVFSFAGLAALVAASGGEESLRAFRELEPFYIASGLLLVGVDLVLGAFRNHIFIRRIRPGTGFMLSFRANAANMFMGAVTPSQGLGGPAQLAVFNLGGIPLGAAASVSVLNFIGTILFFGTGVAAALLLFDHWTAGGAMRSILWACAGLFTAAFLLLAAALFKPSLIKGLIRGLAGFLVRLRVFAVGRIRRMEDLAMSKVDEYHRWCLEFLFRKPGVVLLSVALTVVLYLNKFTISWLIARGLGLDPSWASMFSALYLVTFVSYFAPSPGAGGIAEVATGILLAPLMPGAYLPLFTLLNRSFILFIPAGVGFFTSMGTLSQLSLIRGETSEG